MRRMLAVLGVLAAAAPASAQCRIIDLGTLYGPQNWASAINEAGQIIGSAQKTADGDMHAFLWQDGVMTDLSTLGGKESYANEINGAGQICGLVETARFNRRAFVWQDGVVTDLGTLGGSESEVCGINDSGQIVGTAQAAEGYWRAVLWDPLPVITALWTSAATAVRIAFTAVPPTSATTYHLETADAADGPWTKVTTSVLTELEPDRYQFTVPFDAARAAAFWRVIETVP